MVGEPKRILHIVSSLDRGGAETLIMNVYRNLDRSKWQFDFVTHSSKMGDYEEEIKELGGQIYRIPSLGSAGPFAYIKELVKLMKSHNIAAVHSHTDYQNGFPALAAKLSGIKKIICHSHSSNWQKGSNLSDKITLHFLRSLIRLGATNFCSCSEEAAQFLFGKNHREVRILKNGIDPRQFLRNHIVDRESVISELGLNDSAKIIGHVGRFSESKNHTFILKVMKKLLKYDSKYIIILIGDGPKRKQIEEEAEKMGIKGHIKFLGVRADIPRLMNSFDVFLFPSLFEGFGIVTIEAQCSGTPCVISNTVPKTTDLGLGLASFISFDDGLEKWCSKIEDAVLIKRPSQEKILDLISKYGYNIQNNVNEWLQLYGAS